MFLQWIAGSVFENEEDLKWLEWRVEQMQEFFESSWTYQQMARKKIEQGLEQGREEGLRQSIEMAVQTRFPALLELAHERLAHIQDQELLQQVLVAMIAAATERKARRYLLALNGE